MKIHLAKSAFLQGIQIVQRAIPLKSPMLNLQSVLITARDNRLTFAATDLELGILYEQSAHIAEEGAILIPARLFFELIRRLPDDIIECESIGKSVVLRYGDADFTLNGYDPEEYPEVSGFTGSTKITLPGLILKQLIHQVSFACNNDDEKGGVFTGILMEKTGENLTLVATDTHRLAVNTASFSKEKNDEDKEDDAENRTKETIEKKSWIIPSKSMLELGRLLKNDDQVTIESQRESVRLNFRFNDIEVITRLIDGQYPNYKQVIPSACSTKVLFDRITLLEAVERASLLSRDSYLKTSIVRLNIEDEQIIINKESEMGKIYEKIPVELEGATMAISFNVRYIIDALKNIETEKVVMETSGPFSPCLFRPVDSEDENYINLVLPLRH